MKRLFASVLALSLLAGCTGSKDPVVEEPEVTFDEVVTVKGNEEMLADELIALTEGPPALPTLLLPEASGTKVKESSKAVIDYSNVEDGYVMAQFTKDTSKRIKVKVIGPSTEFAYDMNPKEWTTFPLVDGNGKYSVKVYEQTSGSKYATITSVSFDVTLNDEFAPFLRPNQYVNYEKDAANTLAKAEELTEGLEDPLQKVEKVYDFVINHLTYDKELAQNVQSGYLPVLDTVLEKGKGICFDYAALMTAMLRSQDVPCKLVTGYVGTGNTAYHAWISVWTEETGWVDGAIYFDGTQWQRMDPTFASSGHSSESIMQYIGDGSNYSVKHFY